MIQEDKTFTLRFSLEATFPDDYEGEEDEYAWLADWETHVKPQLLKILFESIRESRTWKAHVRNRGKSPLDEVEVVLTRDFSTPIVPQF